MRTRDSFSHLLPLVGAAVVTAGAVLFQMTRKPASEEAPSSRTAASPADGPGARAGSADAAQSSDTSRENESLLRRLRERGL